jgi:hypothetical protein
LLPVEPLFFDLKISAPEKLRRKLLHNEAYGFRGNLESLCNQLSLHKSSMERLWTLRDPQIANGRPGSSSACTPCIACFSQRGLKLLDRVIWQLRTGADTPNLVRSTGLLGDPIAKLGV